MHVVDAHLKWMFLLGLMMKCSSMALMANSWLARSSDLVAHVLHLEGRLEAASHVSSDLTSWRNHLVLTGDDATINPLG